MRAITLTFILVVAGAAHAQGQAAGKKSAPPAAAPAKEAAKDAAPATGAGTGNAMVPRGPTRIDFDDRLLQGQTNKLGAVYLYQRRTPAQPSLLQRRQGFRDEIAKDLLE